MQICAAIVNRTSCLKARNVTSASWKTSVKGPQGVNPNQGGFIHKTPIDRGLYLSIS